MSIDQHHQEMMKSFHYIKETQIPQLKSEREQLKMNVRVIDKSRSDEINDILIKLQDLKEKMKELKSREKRYLLNNSQFIHKYYSNIKSIENNSNHSVKLNTFFGLDPPTVVYNNNDNNRYWNNNSNDITIEYYNEDECAHCKSQMMEVDGYMQCKKCSNIFKSIGITSTFTRDIPYVTTTNYLRLNHFVSIIDQFSGKQSMTIPDSVIQRIKDRIIKERIEYLDYNILKSILKLLNLHKYIDNILYILGVLGKKSPIMSEELKERLSSLFVSLQEPFAKHCPKDRNNFFGYAFTLYKLCEMIGELQYLPFIPILKDQHKNNEQNVLWIKCISDIII